MSARASDGAEGASAATTVDVVSDVVCPWCHIGKRRLEAAPAQVETAT